MGSLNRLPIFVYRGDMYALDLISNSEQYHIKTINGLLNDREVSHRKSISLALKLGKEMHIIREQFKYGEWTAYVLQKTRYRTMGEAQADMRLWESWKNVIIEIYGSSSFQSIDKFVDSLSADGVQTSLSALQQFTVGEISQSALELARLAAEQGRLTVAEAKRLVKCTKIVSTFPEDQAKYAEQIMKKWNVSNPEVVKMIPEIVKNEDVMETIYHSGTIHVPNVDGDSSEIEISNAGKSDIELALGIAGAEKTLARYANYRSQLNFLKQFENADKNALVQALVEFLSTAEDVNGEDKFQIRVYIKSKRDENPDLTNQKD